MITKTLSEYGMRDYKQRRWYPQPKKKPDTAYCPV